MISCIDSASFWASDSLNWPAFNPFWNAATNISWFRLETFMVSSLKRARNSLSDSPCLWRMPNKAVAVTCTCLLPENWCMSFLWKSAYPVTE
ncbi:hypothetical protein A2U01_0069330, partial [Trifolium medium]|nr:hypothetical protein [Trifolium medium]